MWNECNVKLIKRKDKQDFTIGKKKTLTPRDFNSTFFTKIGQKNLSLQPNKDLLCSFRILFSVTQFPLN